jgi:hypothetical protein
MTIYVQFKFRGTGDSYIVGDTTYDYDVRVVDTPEYPDRWPAKRVDSYRQVISSHLHRAGGGPDYEGIAMLNEYMRDRTVHQLPDLLKPFKDQCYHVTQLEHYRTTGFNFTYDNSTYSSATPKWGAYVVLRVQPVGWGKDQYVSLGERLWGHE